MTIQHKNFFETVKEANMRLKHTVVLYDGEPYYVSGISNHKADGIFRIYLLETGWSGRYPGPPSIDNFAPDDPALGVYLDEWMSANPDKLLRKHMNSPMFNKFRPYPLGMCNYGTETYYIERQPNRKTEQGLIRSMLYQTVVTTGSRSDYPRGPGGIDTWSKEFRACILGVYPTAQECIDNLLDPAIENNAVAFHRDFAIARGPLNMLFVAYKGEIVGVLPNNDTATIRLGRDFGHVKEVVEGLKLFSSIIN